MLVYTTIQPDDVSVDCDVRIASPAALVDILRGCIIDSDLVNIRRHSLGHPSLPHQDRLINHLNDCLDYCNTEELSSTPLTALPHDNIYETFHYVSHSGEELSEGYEYLETYVGHLSLSFPNIHQPSWIGGHFSHPHHQFSIETDDRDSFISWLQVIVWILESYIMEEREAILGTSDPLKIERVLIEFPLGDDLVASIVSKIVQGGS